METPKWIRQSDIDDGVRPGRSTAESTELRAANREVRLGEIGGRSAEDLVLLIPTADRFEFLERRILLQGELPK
jgi:hypothetical protein